jgi:hypothetical protein
MTNRASSRVPQLLAIVCLIAATVMSRLPQILSPNVLLDGDEAILGLMARHLAAGEAFPVFFYGQPYGLALVEAGAGAVAFLLAGSGAVPLKLAILAVWTAGVLFWFAALAPVIGRGWSFATAMLLVLQPAWAVPSMRAHAGYVTAFTASAALIFLVSRIRSSRAAERSWIGAGVLAGIVWLAQPLWMPGLAPFVLFFMLSSGRRLASAACFAAGAAPVFIGARLAATPAGAWQPPRFGNPDLAGSLPDVLTQLGVTLSGSYYLGTTITPEPITRVLADIWLWLIPAAIAGQLWRLWTRRWLLWSHLCAASLLLTLAGNWILLEWRHGRYLLPVAATLAALVGVELADAARRRGWWRRAGAAMLACLVVLGSVSAVEFRRFWFLWWDSEESVSEGERLSAVIWYLRARGVRHAFSTNAMLQWQVAFYSGEKLRCRWISLTDRHQPYVAAVNEALAAGEPVAIVGYAGATLGLEKMVPDPESIRIFDDRYFVYLGAGKELLTRLGFEF